jgi:hypothetical protein
MTETALVATTSQFQYPQRCWPEAPAHRPAGQERPAGVKPGSAGTLPLPNKVANRAFERGNAATGRLTFELSGRRRQDASARTVKMYRVPPAGRWWPAVGAPLERGVRPHCAWAADWGCSFAPNGIRIRCDAPVAITKSGGTGQQMEHCYASVLGLV